MDKTTTNQRKINKIPSYKHIMPDVWRIKNGFKSSVVVYLLVTDKTIAIINARRPSTDDFDYVDVDDEPEQSIKGLINRPRYMG